MKAFIFALITIASFGISNAEAQSAFPLNTGPGGKSVSYASPEKATKKWRMCALVPHMKDSYWVAVDYGLISEAKKLGVAMTVYQAGGYDQLPKQISQFDDCIASKVDAILVAPISEAGLAGKLKEAAHKGIVTVALINPISQSPVSAKVTNDQIAMGAVAGRSLVSMAGDKGAKVVAFPGPQGSGWAEQYLEGFKSAIKGTNVKLLGEKFGDPGVAVQLRLVEDALQTYPDMTAIWGTGPTIEASIGAIAEAGKKNMLLLSSYADQASIDLLKKGKISGFVSDSTVMQGRIAVDQALNILEKRPVEKLLVVPPRLVSQKDAATTDFTTMLAPKDWQPVFSTE